MLVVEVVRQALRTLLAQKVRAGLTLFGFVWGTASVIFLVGWGQGVQEMLERGFAKTGKNLGVMWAGKIGEDFTPAADRRYLWLTSDDIAALRRRARLPELVGAEAWTFLLGTYGQASISLDVRGTDPTTVAIRGVAIGAGRGITWSDVEHRRRVVVLGEKLRRRLLGPRAGVGSSIRLDGKRFRVVGIIAHVGTQLTRDRMEIDEQAWIPITTLQANWPRWWTDEPVVSNVLYRVRDRRLYEATRDELRAILADRLHVPRSDSEAVDGYSPLEIMRQIPIDETRGLLFVIAVTTLVIGGVGILNMMLDSVYARRQEIGIRLAVGARRRDVLLQFFLESFTITALGGGLGVALGVGGCLGLGSLSVPDVVPVPILSPAIVVLAVGVMTAVGLVAALLPAWRATQVDPARTLRLE